MAEVIVVGAGPSGLAAAFRLQQAGHRVRVLESAERAGSTLRTDQRDGFVIDRGAFFIPTTHTSLLKLADDAGISGTIRPGGDVFAAVRGGRAHRLDAAQLAKSFKDTTLISGRAKLAAAKLAPEVWRARTASIERIAEAGRYDYESLATWARRTQHPEVAEYVIEAAVRSMYATEAEDVSRVEFLGVIALFGGAKMVAFEGGMGEYGSKLAALCDVTLGAQVKAVEQIPGGARVTGRRRRRAQRGGRRRDRRGAGADGDAVAPRSRRLAALLPDPPPEGTAAAPPLCAVDRAAGPRCHLHDDPRGASTRSWRGSSATTTRHRPASPPARPTSRSRAARSGAHATTRTTTSRSARRHSRLPSGSCRASPTRSSSAACRAGRSSTRRSGTTPGSARGRAYPRDRPHRAVVRRVRRRLRTWRPPPRRASGPRGRWRPTCTTRTPPMGRGRGAPARRRRG